MKKPIVLEILDVKQFTPAALNVAIEAFFTEHEATHVMSAPSYIVGNQGEERLMLQAVNKELWYRQNEEQGIAQARAQVAGAAEAHNLASGKIVLATGGQIPQVPPMSQGGVPIQPEGRGRFQRPR